jgi:hypothetical protein
VLQSPPWSVPALMATEGAEDAMAEELRPCIMAEETNDVRILVLLCVGRRMKDMGGRNDL